MAKRVHIFWLFAAVFMWIGWCCGGRSITRTTTVVRCVWRPWYTLCYGRSTFAESTLWHVLYV